ncbi:colicin E3-like toxin immunity protein [Yersinia intermedia]|nr:colicin E3-like toxin immunity protein [Yersinia intermedia]
MRFYKDFGGDDTIIEILELPLDDTMNYGGEVA